MADIIYSEADHASFGNNNEVISTQLDLDWTIDFESKSITGLAKHTVKVIQEGVTSANFDSSALTIKSITLQSNGVTSTSNYTVAEAVPAFGSKISIEIPHHLQSKDSTFEIIFEYVTAPSATAMQWLAPSATAGGKYPYVFTQCQAIHARSLLPCMDSPAVKVPYNATIRCPDWCTVLMSAIQDEAASSAGVFRYHQPVGIPAYLIALAAGKLASADISARVRVWSEPSVVPSAAYEFSQTEDFLSAAESLAGPYRWGRYDILCLPPSFPYGGMENPCLTFATPTLLAGDRSLADVIAHEIAHSWTGNLITNATWSHFWLNEGWTVWLERKIMSRVHKEDGIEHLKLSAQIGYEALRDSVNRMLSDSNDSQGFTQLTIPYSNQDPDDAFSSVPYEKGFTFLYYLESLVGTESFELFFKAYVEKFAFQTITSGAFRDYFLQYFAPWSSEVVARIATIDWDLWLTGRGMPPVTHDFTNHLSRDAKALASCWIDALSKHQDQPDGVFVKDISSWSSQQTCIFLDGLLSASSTAVDNPATLTVSALEAMDGIYQFTATKNSEIKYRWLMLGLRGDAAWIVKPAVDFVTSQGRMKYVRPLYRAMRLANVAAEAAIETFNQHQEMYHPIARKMVAVDLTSIQAHADAQG